MIPKSFQKQLSNQHQTWIDFAPNLAPFLDDFGAQDGIQLAPNRFKNQSSNRWSNRHRFRSLLGPILADFGLQLEAQNGPGTALLEPICAQDPTKCSQNGSKTSPKSPRERPKPRFLMILGGLWMDFPCLFHFQCVSDGFVYVFSLDFLYIYNCQWLSIGFKFARPLASGVSDPV